MLIDCTTCVARDVACGDCVITVLLASPPPKARPPAGPTDVVELDDAARAALGHLAGAGLVPPLRLVAPTETRESATDAERMSGNDREIA